MTNLTIEYRSLKSLFPAPNNPRTHTKAQINQIARSIKQFGFRAPVLIDAKGEIVAGHARVEAAGKLGFESVPTICCDDLTEAQIRAYRIADNKLAQGAGWDETKLAVEFDELLKVEFDVELTGFESVEIEGIYASLETVEPADEDDDDVPTPNTAGPAVSRLGDLWLLGEHKLYCADATLAASYTTLLGDERATMVFTDPPYNVPINGHVSGLGEAQHREFVMASGEMTEEEFVKFLRGIFQHLVGFTTDGSIHFVCMDWRHAFELQSAARGLYTEMKNICVWMKTNGGMGSLYRSQHEFVFVYKNGTAAHVNNVKLGKFGRYRTNVWRYAGANSFSKTRDDDLADHPTIKPVALVTDAIKDCSRQGNLILDPFLGSGTTILAAEKAGRRAAALELDPAYVDVAIRRFEVQTGKKARLAETGETFEVVATERAEADQVSA